MTAIRAAPEQGIRALQKGKKEHLPAKKGILDQPALFWYPKMY